MIIEFFQKAHPGSVVAISAALAISVLAISISFSKIYRPPPAPFDPEEYCIRGYGDQKACVEYLIQNRK